MSSRETQEATIKPIPGTNESMVVGRIENLVPIGVLTVLGCEKCSVEALKWALQQGSSFDDVERWLNRIEVMQKLDCFKTQFGPEVSIRLRSNGQPFSDLMREELPTTHTRTLWFDSWREPHQKCII